MAFTRCRRPPLKPCSQTILRQMSKRDKNRRDECEESVKNSAVIPFEVDIRLQALSQDNAAAPDCVPACFSIGACRHASSALHPYEAAPRLLSTAGGGSTLCRHSGSMW